MNFRKDTYMNMKQANALMIHKLILFVVMPKM
jgi:hypothetical protein